MFDEDSSSFMSHEDHRGIDGEDDGGALVADVAIAVLPSQFHLAICQAATYSSSHFPSVYEGQLVAGPVHTQFKLLLILVNGG